MKYSIYIRGRGWTFQLAEAFSKTDNLDFLVTSYPKFTVKKYNVPSNKIKSIFFLEILRRLLGKFNPLFKKLKINFDAVEITDRLADTIYSLLLSKFYFFFITSNNIYFKPFFSQLF